MSRTAQESPVKISVNLEGMAGLTWPLWQRLVETVEGAGFAGLFRSDHFTMPSPPDLDALELVVSLAYLASHSRRVHFGSLVAPLSFRDPILLARQAMALDDLSDGRMVLGVGAGWMVREHAMFGYDLASPADRFARLEEGLEVITRLTRSQAPVSFAGRFYRLHEAQLLPRPQRAVPLLIGGNGPKRTLPLAARYADIWNSVGATPQVFSERSALLDDLARRVGRQPGDIRRTVMLPAICWRDAAERQRRLAPLCAAGAPFAGLSPDGLEDFLKEDMAGVFGSPEQVIAGLRAYATAGADELMLQWWNMADLEGLEVLAGQVIPFFSA